MDPDETRPRGRQFQAVSRQKIIPNLPILRINHEFKGIMVNMGRIHRELRNFLTYSSNLIKSDEKLMVEIGENGIL